MRLLKRGRRILQKEGVADFIRRSMSYLKHELEVVYYGTVAERNAPITYHGVEIPVDMDVFTDRIRHAFSSGSYEKEEVALINEYVTEPYDVVDLGASTGFTTTYTLKRLDDAVAAVAVEANPAMVDVLREVKKRNGVEYRIENSAYDPTEAEVEFYIHDKTVSSSTKRDDGKKITASGISVERIIDEYDLDEFICLVDIEGGEIDLVGNELQVLEDRCRLIIMEIHDIDEIASETKQALDDSAFYLVDSTNDVYAYMNNME